MAGRPRKKAEKIGEIEEYFTYLGLMLMNEIPEQYRGEIEPKTDLSIAWNNALCTALRATAKIIVLGDMLRERAGITEPGPYEEFMRECGECEQDGTQSDTE